MNTPAASPENLIETDFRALAGWIEDDHVAAFGAFLASAKHMVEQKPYKTRGLGISGNDLLTVARRAIELQSHKLVDKAQARNFFDTNFIPHTVLADGTEGEGNGTGFITGFFEPVMLASRTCSPQYPIPLYRRPDDLVDVNDSNRPEWMDGEMRYGKKTDHGLEEYLDRSAIQSGALRDQGLELVWLQNKVDAFFIHVQGAAKLQLTDGNFLRVTYAAKSGHPYTSVAKVLCAQLGVLPQTMPSDALASWMHNNPDMIDALLAHNQSYIFFKMIEDQDVADGPIAAAKVPLIAGRSMAVDRQLHTFGCPIWLETDDPLPNSTDPLARLMVAHDTGSAITGAARGDYFAGTGDEAGLIGGRIRHSARLTVLVPKP